MESSLIALLAKSSKELGLQLKPGDVRRTLGDSYASLDDLLALSNGFYAFHGALHVFPLSGNGDERGILEWNLPTLWRSSYPYNPPSGIFFAEDIFGGQFWTNGHNVCWMDEESGILSSYAQSLEDWARIVLLEDGNAVGANLASQWIAKNGLLRSGLRLAPKIPFLLEGSSAFENLYAANSLDVMKFRGDLASQLKNIPDGNVVRVKVT